MKIPFRFLVLFLALICGAAPAYADIDHLCLKQCMNTGGASAACLTQCAYDPAKPLTAQSSLQKSLLHHRTIEAPTPDGLNMPPHTPSPEALNKDYTCLSQCLKGKQAYSLCEQHCTKPQCTAGTSLCRIQQSKH